MYPNALMNKPGEKVRRPAPAQWLQILEEGGEQLQSSPFTPEGRRILADTLERHGFHYPARSLLSGKIVPLFGREYFPPRVHSFSIFDGSAEERGIKIIPVTPEQPANEWLPASLGLYPLNESMMPHKRWKRDHFVASIEGGHCVVCPWGYAIFDQNQHYATDFCRNDGPLIAWSGVVPISSHIPGTVAVLTHSWSNAVFHWMMETMPRFELLRLAGFPVDLENVDYIVVRRVESWHLEYIDRLGIPRDKFMAIGDIGHISADRLLVCSNVEDSDWSIDPPYFEPEPWVSRFVANTIPDEDPTEPTEKIYISRAKAGSRRIANGDDLRIFLEKNGFRTVFFEDMTAAEKAAQMRRAAVVVTPSGAALTHVPFMRPGAKCVVLYPEDHFVSLFNALCANSGVIHIHAVFPSIVRLFPSQFTMMAEHLREQFIDIPHLAEIMAHFDIPVSL